MALNFSFDDLSLFNFSDFVLNVTQGTPIEDYLVVLLPDELPDSLKTTIIVLYTIIITGAFLGNSLVICVILANAAMRNVTNVFLVSLAISDILIAVWNMPMMLVYHLDSEWTLGSPLCKTLSFVTCVSVFASIVTLTAVSIERYYAVCHPLKARYIRTNKRAAIALVVIWTLAIGVSLPFTWIQRIEPRLKLNPNAQTIDEYLKKVEVCAEYYPSENLDIAHTYLIFIFLYLAPMCIMCFTYSSITYRLWLRKPIGDSQESPQNIHNVKRRIVKMLIIIVLLFGICWLPFFAVQIYRLNVTVGNDYRVAMTIIQLVGYSNSMMNPLVYGFMNRKFQDSLRDMILRCRKKNYVGTNGVQQNGHATHSITVESAV